MHIELAFGLSSIALVLAYIFCYSKEYFLLECKTVSLLQHWMIHSSRARSMCTDTIRWFKPSGFAKWDVEAEIVGCSTPIHPLVREDYNPGHKSYCPECGAYRREYYVLLDSLLPREFLPPKAFSKEPYSVDSPYKREKCHSDHEILCTETDFILICDFFTLQVHIAADLL